MEISRASLSRTQHFPVTNDFSNWQMYTRLGKSRIANIKKQKHDTDFNYLKHVDPSSAGNEVPYVE